MDNIKLLKYCINNPETFLDYNYMFVDIDKDLNKYANKTKLIKHKLIAIKETISKHKSKNIVNQLLNELQKELGNYANYSEFGAFINACDSKIEEVYNDKILLKEITFLYLKRRELNDIVPAEWIQALIDKGSSRKKGHVGENKLINILKNKGYIILEKINDFEKYKKCVAKFSKSGDFSNKSIKNKFNISIGKNTQNKTLDLIIKRNSGIYFLEAKHLNTGGGGQNKQILELIDLIKNKTDFPNHHFVAFLDGLHSNTLLNCSKSNRRNFGENKIQNQYFDLIKILKIRKDNYWMNTAGFKKIFN